MRAAFAIVAALTGSAVAGPLPAPPPASTEPTLPPGIVIEPVTVPSGPAFKPRPAKWWTKKKPCPPGAKLETIVADKAMRRYFARAFVCRDAKGEQHGPGIAIFEDGSPYEDAWSVHGKNHGTRWTWNRNGTRDHMETFVDDLLHGPATEWTGDRMLREGQYKNDKRYGLWVEHYPTDLVIRGYYTDGGDAVGTFIGTRAGVATAIVVEEHRVGVGGTYRIFDATGALTFERRIDEKGGRATGYLKGVRIAEYDCRPEGRVGESRFYDDAGVLQRRFDPDTSTLTDAKGAVVKVTDEQRYELSGVRHACSGAIWMLEGAPPSRHTAFGQPPPTRAP